MLASEGDWYNCSGVCFGFGFLFFYFFYFLGGGGFVVYLAIMSSLNLMVQRVIYTLVWFDLI